MNLPFLQLDVFAPAALSGNPLAVVCGADALDARAMQSVARWLGLSETTFLLPPTEPDADYRVRIFTPGGELPFAGHPTLGSAAAWLLRGGQPAHADTVMQQCGVGLVPVRRDPATANGGDALSLAFAAPAMRVEPVAPELQRQVAAALGIDPDGIVASAWLDNGPRWLSLWLPSAAAVLDVDPDHAALRRLQVKVGLAGPHPAGSAAAIEVRAFVAHLGVAEDPVTGSLNASLGQWLIGNGVLPPSYVAAQGTAIGRAGRVRIDRDAQGQIWVGGAVRRVIAGDIAL
jgi:PhzF family phenazine biosynthesis protein